MNTVDKDVAYLVQCDEYCNYIKNHVENVKLAYRNLFKDPTRYQLHLDRYSDEEVNIVINRLADVVETHDQSKWTDEEFYPYRAKYNMTDEEKRLYATDEVRRNIVDSEFEEAWKHHYTNNDHHPKFWVEGEEKHDMSLLAILHMICDWEAMSIAQHAGGGKGLVEWYNTRAIDEKNAMSTNTRKTVEEVIEKLFNVELPKAEE